MLTLAAIIATVAAGQAPPTEVRPVTLEGKIREVAGGHAGRPRAMLVDAEASRPLFALDPAFNRELRRLAGLVVRVHRNRRRPEGRRQGSRAGRSLRNPGGQKGRRAAGRAPGRAAGRRRPTTRVRRPGWPSRSLAAGLESAHAPTRRRKGVDGRPPRYRR